MMNKKVIVGLVGVIALFASHTYAKCEKESSLNIKPVEANAAGVANMMNRPGTIRHEMDNMLKIIFDEQKVKEPVVINVIPKKFLEKYGDKEKCKELLAKTQKSPLSFDPGSFDNLDGLQDWILDFSKGKGKEGKKLYDQCDGKCSPQYSYEIEKADAKYEVVANVICGEARDKDNDMYLLDAQTKSCK